LVIFEICMPRPAWTTIFLYASQTARITGMCHHTQLFISWNGISQTFCLGWPQTTILHDPASHGARITGLNYQAQWKNHFY
jgi:hypothetical protein